MFGYILPTGSTPAKARVSPDHRAELNSNNFGDEAVDKTGGLMIESCPLALYGYGELLKWLRSIVEQPMSSLFSSVFLFRKNVDEDLLTLIQEVSSLSLSWSSRSLTYTKTVDSFTLDATKCDKKILRGGFRYLKKHLFTYVLIFFCCRPCILFCFLGPTQVCLCKNHYTACVSVKIQNVRPTEKRCPWNQ